MLSTSNSYVTAENERYLSSCSCLLELGSFFSEHVKILSFKFPNQVQKVNRAAQAAMGGKELSHG